MYSEDPKKIGKTIDPNSIWGIFITNIIDKLLIGGLAFLLIFTFQKKAEDNKALFDFCFEAAKINNDVLANERVLLTKDMRSYIDLLTKIVRSGDKIQQNERNLLNDLRHNMQNSINIMVSINEDIKEHSEELIDCLNDIRQLSQEENAIDKIANSKKILIDEFTIFLKQFRMLSVKTVVRDYKSVKEIMATAIRRDIQ